MRVHGAHFRDTRTAEIIFVYPLRCSKHGAAVWEVFAWIAFVIMLSWPGKWKEGAWEGQCAVVIARSGVQIRHQPRSVDISDLVVSQMEARLVASPSGGLLQARTSRMPRVSNRKHQQAIL